MIRFRAFILGNLAVTFGVTCLVLIIVAALMLAGQCFVWLKYGYWEPYPLSSLLIDSKLGLPRAPRLWTIQKIADFVLSWPATACLAGAAGVCFAMGKLLTELAGYYERKLRQCRHS
jgi:hypothetical protein